MHADCIPSIQNPKSKIPMTDPQLLQRIRDSALLRGTFTLRSGRTSSYYLDKYLFETQPDILAALAERFAKFVTPTIDRIAGPELGGVPLATATALLTNKPLVLLRNAKKAYGTAKQFEGKLDPGDRVLITEDIATTGGQSIESATALRDLGVHVERIVVVIDRQEGARENIESAGFAFDALFTKADLGINE
jgi:orotate phosphoribosyltransferase